MTVATTPAGVEVLAPADPEIVSAEALGLVAALERELRATRGELLERRRERQAELDGVDQVRLADDTVLPGRRVGVLEVGHEDPGARVERVDHHLPVGRPGDLDSAVREVGRGRRHPQASIPTQARCRKIANPREEAPRERPVPPGPC